MCTGTSLSVCQEGWDDDDPPLPHTHAQETLVHAFDDVTLTQVGVVGRIPRMTKGGTTQSVWGAHKQQEKLLTSHDLFASHTGVYSPGVKGLPGEQGAIIVVSDEVRRRCGTVAARRLADCTDLDLVLGVPYVHQENVVHQHGVGWNHTACQKNTHHQHTHQRGRWRWRRLGPPVPMLP